MIFPLPALVGISSPFGAGRSGDRPDECGSGHCGVDLPAEVGTAVLAVAGGMVLTAQPNEAAGGAAGRYIVIEHDAGLRTHYVHLDAVNVKSKDWVEEGQAIGTVGMTGNKNSPPHLHFAVNLGGSKYTDPAPYLANAGVAESGLLVLAMAGVAAYLLLR